MAPLARRRACSLDLLDRSRRGARACTRRSPATLDARRTTRAGCRSSAAARCSTSVATASAPRGSSLGEPDEVHGEARLGRGGVDEHFAGIAALRRRARDVPVRAHLARSSNTIEVIGARRHPARAERVRRSARRRRAERRGAPRRGGQPLPRGAGRRVRRDPRRARACCSAATRCAARRRPRRAAALGGLGLALLAGVQQVLRVEGLLDPVVQVVARRAELVLELAALQPADAVLAADRAAEAQRELEQLVARVVGALLLVEVVGREEERRVDVAVACVAERERRPRRGARRSRASRARRRAACRAARRCPRCRRRRAARGSRTPHRRASATARRPRSARAGACTATASSASASCSSAATRRASACGAVGLGDDHERGAVRAARTGTRRPRTAASPRRGTRSPRARRPTRARARSR